MAKQKPAKLSAPDPFAELYPNVARWVKDGWIEIGRDHYSRSFIRVLDLGGMVWEGETTYSTVHEALTAADAAIADWFAENG